MSCKDTRCLLDLYLDNELGVPKRREIEQHLNDCRECQILLDEEREFRAFFATNAPYSKAPAELRARLLARIKTPDTRKKEIALAYQPWAYAAALFVLSLSLMWLIFFPDKETTLVLEAASDHSRAVLLERLCDVVSPDPGVVKQWLAAKLDFTPAVVGVSNPEFQLRGGRVDAIQNRKIAALVYGRSNDLVGLFLWPAAGRLLPSKDFSISGYQVCTWNAASFDFVAVSTLNDRDLDRFIDQIRDQVK